MLCVECILLFIIVLLLLYYYILLLYSCETWTINEQDKKKLEAMEMFMWRRLIKISWIERKINVDVLNQVEEKIMLLNTIKERSGKMIGHLFRHNLFMTNIFEDRINGYKGRGRLRKAYIEEMIKQADCSRYIDTKRLASNREEWQSRFATTRQGL
jgi:hypothetical protein